MPPSLQTIKQNKQPTGRLLCQLVIVCLCFLLPIQAGAMEGPEARRLMAGLELFPSFLAADLQIQTKKAVNGSLQLVILYNKDKRTAEKMANRLKQIGNIKSIPLDVTVIWAKNFNQSNIKPAGFFISEEHITNLPTIIQYAKQHSIITFSPFTPDLQQGVTCSISITARIRPYVNMNTLKESQLEIKPFFLRISKQYP